MGRGGDQRATRGSHAIRANVKHTSVPLQTDPCLTLDKNIKREHYKKTVMSALKKMRLTRKCPMKQIKRIKERMRKAIPKDNFKIVVLKIK